MEPLPRYFPLDRVVAFSDGVFAVVITILVLGIEVPSALPVDASPSVVAEARDKLLHQVLVYVLAFALVAMYWAQHGLLYGGLRKAGRRLVGLSLLFLLPVSLLPFVTQLMGSRREDWKAVLVFAAVNLVTAWLISVQWAYVLTLPETHKDGSTTRLARRIARGARIFAAVLLLGVLASLVHVKTGTALMLLMPFVFFVDFVRDRPPSEPVEAPEVGN